MNRLKLHKGDITILEVDAIVNAANSSLMGGGGVDGAIHLAGGPIIMEECMDIIDKQGSCDTGEAVITSGGDMPCHFVVHTVGPVWHGGEDQEDDLLENCYQNSLQLAVENGVKTIAFPNISTGVYRFPKVYACRIAIKAVREFLDENTQLDEVIFVCFDDENYDLYEQALNKMQLEI